MCWAAACAASAVFVCGTRRNFQCPCRMAALSYYPTYEEQRGAEPDGVAIRLSI
ncbi:hypothetical protein KCP78_14695 [Salmonella enterica subsp. enterica]|nr:hypothetical protein KCP78_14695 [Salmonella enterica subsp. enterica]